MGDHGQTKNGDNDLHVDQCFFEQNEKNADESGEASCYTNQEPGSVLLKDEKKASIASSEICSSSFGKSARCSGASVDIANAAQKQSTRSVAASAALPVPPLSINAANEVTEELVLKYGAGHVISLFVPVSICMAVVIFTMVTIGYYSEQEDGVYLIYTPFIPTRDADTGTQILLSLGNAVTMIGFVAVMTCVMIALYKFRCYKVLHVWLFASTLMLLSVFSLTYVKELFKNFNVAVDYPTVLFGVWNWACLGMICIHWRGPLILQQAYLISIAALLALIFIKYLPEWTVWTVLGALSIWDLIAVLCPHGPLRILVETAQRRNEPLFPALIYSSGMVWQHGVLGIVSPSTLTTTLSLMNANQSSNEDNAGFIAEDDETPEEGGENVERGWANEDSNQPANPLGLSNNQASCTNGNNFGDGGSGGSNSSTTALLRHNLSSGAGTSAVIYSRKRDSDGEVRCSLTGKNASKTGSVKEVADCSKIQVVTSNANPSQAQLSTAVRFAPTRGKKRSSEQQQDSTRQQSSRNNVDDNSRIRNENRVERGDKNVDPHLMDEGGIKLGLGDFIFYSVLVGKASSYGDWNTTLACYIAILVGLAFTLMLLALCRRALPALPISITAGIFFFFATREIITPFTTAVSMHRYLL